MSVEVGPRVVKKQEQIIGEFDQRKTDKFSRNLGSEINAFALGSMTVSPVVPSENVEALWAIKRLEY